MKKISDSDFSELRRQNQEDLQKIETTSGDRIEKKLKLIFGVLEKTYPPMKVLLFRSFITGLFTALGATIGLSLVLALVTYLLGVFQAIPALGGYLQNSGIDTLFKK